MDNALTEAEVEAFVTNAPLDFSAGTSVDGQLILTEGANGSLSGLTCLAGEVAKYDAVWVYGDVI